MTAPYEKIVGSAAAATPTTDSTVMINAIMPVVKSGLYESILSTKDSDYTLRFLSDLHVLSKKALAINMATAQWGMSREETGSLLKLPPGPWWFAPIGLINSTFNLLDNKHGDRIAGQILAALMFMFIFFPYIPFINRIPKYLPFAPFIWRVPIEKK